jgi:hypothetical protein
MVGVAERTRKAEQAKYAADLQAQMESVRARVRECSAPYHRFLCSITRAFENLSSLILQRAQKRRSMGGREDLTMDPEGGLLVSLRCTALVLFASHDKVC